MLSRLLLLATLVLAFGCVVNAQEDRTTDRQSGRLPKDDKSEGHFPDEMLKKMEIARKESDHKKLLEDVDKLGDLTDEFARSFSAHQRVSPEDVKKLATIEKLAKHVLVSAGGEEVDGKPEATASLTISDAVDKLSAAAASIRKDMKAETRFVVSASVIANSNEVITLARFIKHNQKAD